LNERELKIKEYYNNLKKIKPMKGMKIKEGEIEYKISGFYPDAIHLNRRKSNISIKNKKGNLKLEPCLYKKIFDKIKSLKKNINNKNKLAEICLLTIISSIMTYILFGMPLPVLLGTTKTWAATAAGNASSGSNWSPSGVPATGDDIVFDSTSTYSCTWDLSDTFGSFSINSGYTGTITQSADFTVSSFSIADGTFTGSTSYWLTCSGNWTKTGGTVTQEKLRLKMTGDGTTLTALGDVVAFYLLWISANISVTSDYTYGVVPYSLTIDSGKQ